MSSRAFKEPRSASPGAKTAPGPWLPLAASVPVAMAVVVALEATRVPRAEHPAALLGLGLVAALSLLWVPLSLSMAATLLLGVAPRLPRLAGRAAATTLALLATGHAYTVVAEYPAFATHPPLLALFALLLLFLSVALLLAVGRSPRLGPSSALAAIGLLGFAATSAGNRLLYRGAYPTLHLGLLEVSYLLLLTGLSAALLSAPSRLRARTLALPPALLVVAGAACLAAGAAFGASARPGFVRFTDLGRSHAMAEPLPGAAPLARVAAPPLALDPTDAASGARERFAELSGLPPLPQAFHLRDHDLLLLSIETTRCRDTDLCNPGIGTTPHLAELAERRGVVFTRAYSGAGGTLASMGSMMTMTHPSSLDLRMRDRWHGTLGDAETTVAELLSSDGYRTFYAGHDYKGHFTRGGIAGLHQGFEQKRFAPGGHHSLDDPTVDAVVARLALQALRERAEDGARYFGWVFFESPHEPYIARPPLTADAWPRQRYRGELRYADRQLGEVLAHLERQGLFDTTVVIVHGDHGEAFGEHERGGHADVYSEVSHVPLVLFVPGMPPTRVDHVTSLVHVLPWLLLTGEGTPRRFAEDRVATRLVPMLEATGGAMLTEVLCDGCERVSLVSDSHRVVRDTASGYLELYELTRDPLEIEDIFDAADPVSQDYARRFEGYDAVRATPPSRSSGSE